MGLRPALGLGQRLRKPGTSVSISTMTDPLHVSEVRFTAASEADQRDGLLGFIRCLLRGALLDHLAPWLRGGAA